MLTLIIVSSVRSYIIIIIQKGEIMKFCCMYLIYFVASFAALHYGMVAFGYDLLALPFVVEIPGLAKGVMIVFGLCGLLSIISMIFPCKPCGDKCCKK